MTVIVGLEYQEGLVLGADRLQVKGDLYLSQFLRYTQTENPNYLSFAFKFLQEKGLDKIKFSLGSKIHLSKNQDSVLMHTGTNNDTNKQIYKFLLNPDEFLQDDSFLLQMLFPFEIDPKIAGQVLDDYKNSFNLEKRLKQGYVPEIRRIFDLAVAKKHEVDSEMFKLAWWDRNYHTALSEYLFAKRFQSPESQKIILLDIFLTGALTRRQYYAKGCGGEFALEYMRKRLGTSGFRFIHDSESQIKQAVEKNEAIDIVTNAVKYTNEKSEFCQGLDYAIITPSGIETHFTNNQEGYEIGINSLIDKRINSLKKEITQLKKIKTEYNKK